MNVFPYLLLLTLFILGIAAVVESVAPNVVLNILRQSPSFEGFEDAATSNSLNFWSSFTSRRHDIGDTQEEGGYIRDPRYFSGYVDVSRLGVPYDFCRIVASESAPTTKFFACALAGTENLSSTEFRTDSTAQGFRLSIDDYMTDTNADGRADYCRILRWKGSNSFQPVCALARDITFDSREIVDPSPPPEIAMLLTFYQGCILWYRFHGDIKDIIGDTNAMIAGALTIDETPRGSQSEAAAGLQFNGVDQFIRLSDTPYFALGKVIPLRSIRSWMVWVYFDEFTNNAKIFDFGNGSSADNVFLGILRKGDPGVQSDTIRNLACETQPSTVPTAPSGAQPVLETSPKNWMETSAANVNDFTSGGFEISPRILTDSSAPKNTGQAQVATLLYEVWDKQARKLQVKINAVIPVRRWTHIAITATSNDAFRPSIGFYINGAKVYEKADGFLPATSVMTNCYLGKSNWTNETSTYENSDDLFKGRLFDFRAYTRPLSNTLIRNSYTWGREKLGLYKASTNK
jgi:hypothetical protein